MQLPVILLIALLAAPTVQSHPDADSLESALRTLSASTAADRGRAERWLAVHLESADFSKLAEAALSGASEVRIRIARALGADDRHLDLAVLMASDPNSDLVALGEEAIREIAGRWRPGLGRPLAVDGPDRPALRAALSQLRETWPGERVQLELTGTVDRVVSRFARLAELPVFLCVDPYTEASPFGGTSNEATVTGTWDEVLLKLAVEFSINLEAALVIDEQQQPQPLFICFRPRGGTNAAPVTSMLSEWCQLSLGTDSLAMRAARALAGTGWPAALQWFDRRYRERADRVALEGLLLSANRGRVALSLHCATGVSALLAEVDRLAPGPEAEQIMWALAAMTPVGIDGERLDEMLVEGWDELESTAIGIRLIALEGMTSTSPRVRAAIRALLARSTEEVDAAQRLRALRTWLQVGGGEELKLAHLNQLWNGVRDSDAAEELVQLLLGAGVVPTARWENPKGFDDLSLEARVGLFEWHLAAGQMELATAHLEQLCPFEQGWPADEASRSAQAAVARVLRRGALRGAGDRQRRWLDSIAAARPEAEFSRALYRLVILSGAPALNQTQRDLACLSQLLAGENPSFPVGDELVLGTLGARPVPAIAGPARAALFRRLGNMLARRTTIDLDGSAAERVLAGLEHCMVQLLGRGDDLLVELIGADVHDLFRRFPRHPLNARIRSSAWPPGPSSGPKDLSKLDRRL